MNKIEIIGKTPYYLVDDEIGMLYLNEKEYKKYIRQHGNKFN